MVRILLVNDDGFHAPGFALIREIAAELSDEIWSVAPATDQSGLAHSLTLSHPLRLSQVAERDFMLSGTPTDCVIMGVRDVMPEPPDLILSGVNHGQNAGDDITYSGTVAAAMEGALLDIPAIALSQQVIWTTGETFWDTTRAHAVPIIKKLLDKPFDNHTFMNVNFPACSAKEVEGVSVVPQGRLDHSLHFERRIDGRNKPYYWMKFAHRDPRDDHETDITALRKKRISVTPLKPDFTDWDHMKDVETLLNEA